jgi:phage shock protein C
MQASVDRRAMRDAAERLEQAVHDLARSAGGALSSQAVRLMEDFEASARRLRQKIDGNRSADAQGEPTLGQEAARLFDDLDGAARRLFDHFDATPRDRARDGATPGAASAPPPAARATRANGWLRGLYRDPDRRMIAGVCAGVGRAYGVEPWVARLIAVSLLLFMPQIAFFGYIAAIFLLARTPSPTAARAGLDASRAGAPELGGRLAPRPALRVLRVRFTDLELRLRRIEGYVTSTEFALERELNRLEQDDEGAARSSPTGGSA